MILPIRMIKVYLDSFNDHYYEEENSDLEKFENNIVQLPYVVLDTCVIEALTCLQEGKSPLFTIEIGVMFTLI